jgi:glucose/arabinose dehydrogenase
MRSSLVVAAPVGVAVAIVVVHAACTGGHAVSGGISPDAAPVDVPASIDAGPLPQAVGNPCRGVPLTDPDGGTPSYFVAEGMCATVVGESMGPIRQLTFAPNGDLFVTTSALILLLNDANGDGFYTKDEIHVWTLLDGGNGNNTELDVAGGFVYAGSLNGVKRFAYTPGALTAGASEDVVIGQPSGGHSYHTTHIYDGFLYVHSGSAGNVAHESGPTATDYDTKRSLIKRFDLSKFVSGTPFQWDAGEPFTLGLRNANGFRRNELTGKIYAVVNGLDGVTRQGADVHLDNPGEQVVEVAAGKKYGYPFCFTAQRVLSGGSTGPLLAPGTQIRDEAWATGVIDDAWCAANSLPPTTFIQAHSAPLDLLFFDRQPTGALPERWRGGAFIALHGSWNREGQPTGYKVVWMPFKPDGTAPMPTSTETTTTFPYETVFGGGDKTTPKDGPWSWTNASANASDSGPRPAGLAISPIDGALYVASDTSQTLYRLGIPPQ